MTRVRPDRVPTGAGHRIGVHAKFEVHTRHELVHRAIWYVTVAAAKANAGRNEHYAAMQNINKTR